MIGKFRNQATARNFSYRTTKPSMIILGDDNRYWVVTMAKGNKLEQAGYTVIK